MQATYARCAAASKVPLPVVGYLCFLLSNAKAQAASALAQQKAQGEDKGEKVVP
jgi:hypothetical protein